MTSLGSAKGDYCARLVGVEIQANRQRKKHCNITTGNNVVPRSAYVVDAQQSAQLTLRATDENINETNLLHEQRRLDQATVERSTSNATILNSKTQYPPSPPPSAPLDLPP